MANNPKPVSITIDGNDEEVPLEIGGLFIASLSDDGEMRHSLLTNEQWTEFASMISEHCGETLESGSENVQEAYRVFRNLVPEGATT